jgi:hypothetical protein
MTGVFANPFLLVPLAASAQADDSAWFQKPNVNRAPIVSVYAGNPSIGAAPRRIESINRHRHQNKSVRQSVQRVSFVMPLGSLCSKLRAPKENVI